MIVSGGAIGGDSAAHNGAMESGGYTVGVLGAGVNSGYLKQNEELREDSPKRLPCERISAVTTCNKRLISEKKPHYVRSLRRSGCS